MRKMISEKEAQLIKQNAADIEAVQDTLEKVSVTEAGALNIDSNLEVVGDIEVGDATTADSPKIILHSTPASNQGDWAIYTTGSQQFIYLEQIGQNSGIKISRSSILPGSHNYVSLGNSQFAFKDLVLRGNIDFGSSSNIKLNSVNGKIEATVNGSLNTRFAQNQTESNVNLIPTGSNQYDLGSQSNQWKDLYISGNVFFTGLPTSDPQVAGQLWNDNGTLKISAGE